MGPRERLSGIQPVRTGGSSRAHSRQELELPLHGRRPHLRRDRLHPHLLRSTDPRYTESNKVDEAKAETRSAKELERVAYDKLKQAREEAAAALKEKDAANLKSVAQLKKQLEESREELNQALAQKQGELKDARGKLDDLSGRVSSDLASANRRVAQLTRLLEEERKEAAVAQKPLKDKLVELQSRNDSLYSLYIRANEQLKAEREKSIAQKVFGLSPDKDE